MRSFYFLIALSLCTIFMACEKQILIDEAIENEAAEYDLAGVTTKKANKFNTMFNTFGNGWTGSDATYSVLLPDGRTVWLMGDSFLDTVYADYTRPGSDLIRNTFLVQTGYSFTTLVSGTIDDPGAFVNTPDPADQWYWPGDGTVQGDTLYVFMMYFHATGGGGLFGFEYERTDLVTFALPSITEVSRTVVSTDPNILFGSAVMEDADYTYIYGAEQAFGKYMHVARVPAGNIRGTMEYWNGTSWVTTPPASNVGRLEKQSGLPIDVSAQFAVFYYGGKYRLVTQEDFLSPNIYTWESVSPKGPWKKRQTVYVTPYISENSITYNAFVHPQFVAADGSLLLSYNENTTEFLELFSNARIYRPKFIWFKYL